ncbi:RnfABCDGE type electron transport complex subunit D [Jannaschia seohaensis]|uniref:Na+-transporting NADH:ubiquinone oxidoreductase subunit B n=1 Tax=Jannaschia seohaensis TaxID=475081 RepID=A0A2Y9AZW9_9RHOB|nr:RnfABCDGE type electron transport complex subunit D [Jannaschia seohaensis]PWJ16953.1 Na+-transporting NADH:ubiquinone oxidoreductase subunit B [Jannaschia seohaensis]SSA48187.1 Na+-transporting NADH:ubiquinone oxidoreductase subunit B [Jannaschia seohaensis]
MIRGLWTRETVALLTVAALMPLALFWIWFGGSAAVFRLALVLLVIAIWQLVFMLSRAQPPSLSLLVTALAIAMLAPEGLSVFQFVLGISFGVVIGELIFGGWGRNVVNPGTVALAFLGFGFPAAPWPVFDTPLAWAAIPAAGLGLVIGVMPSALVLAGLAVGAIVATFGLVSDPVLFAAGIVFVLLVCDPVTSAATTLGGWVQGATYGALVVLFGGAWSGAAPPQIAVAAALLSSLAAPLFDDIALRLWVHRRRRRYGRS